MTLARRSIEPTRLDKLAALEDGLQIVAVREISDVVDVANATSLRDNDAVKELSDLKKNAAQTMLLLERVGRYVATRRGDITFGHPMFDNKLPGEVERAAERKVIDAIARFRLNKLRLHSLCSTISGQSFRDGLFLISIMPCAIGLGRKAGLRC